MNTTETILDLVERTRDSLKRLPDLDAAQLNVHPGGHPNSPAWLLWHTGREIDMQLASLTGEAEIWESAGYRERFNLGDIGDTMGYGHDDAEAKQIRLDDHDVATAYVDACLRAVADDAAKRDDDAWDEAIATYEGQPVTRQVRVTSVLIDALEHLGQVHYVAGMDLGE